MIHVIAHLLHGGNPPRSIVPPIRMPHIHPIVSWALRGGWRA